MIYLWGTLPVQVNEVRKYSTHFFKNEKKKKSVRYKKYVLFVGDIVQVNKVRKNSGILYKYSPKKQRTINAIKVEVRSRVRNVKSAAYVKSATSLFNT